MHYYKFNIADWNLGTAHLTLEEEATYLRLVNLYYDSQSPIPVDTKPVIRRLRLGSNKTLIDQILTEFFELTDNGWTHKKCDELLKDYRKTLKKNKVNGAKGGRPRADAACSVTQSEPSGLVVGYQMDPSGNPNQEPLTTNQEPITKEIKRLEQPAVDSVHFETFWNAGMRKISKKKSQSLFNNLLKKSKTEPAMFAEMLCKDIQARTQANQLGFADMHPTTYLNGERWTDDIHSPTPPGRAPATAYDPDFVAPF